MAGALPEKRPNARKDCEFITSNNYGQVFSRD